MWEWEWEWKKSKGVWSLTGCWPTAYSTDSLSYIDYMGVYLAKPPSYSLELDKGYDIHPSIHPSIWIARYM